MTTSLASVRSDDDREPDGPTRRRGFGWTVHTMVILLYAALSLVSNGRVWLRGASHSLPRVGGNDVFEQMWFLAETPWAVIRGIDPLANHLLNYPYGVNLMDNTLMPALGALVSPVTLTAGPVAAWNLLYNLAFVTSATAGYFMARRFVPWTPAAVAAGLLYGFSPFAIAQGHGHIFLMFDPIPAVIVIVVDRALRTRETSMPVGGALLGLALVVQLYISAETFASSLVMLAVAAALWLAETRGRPAVDRRALVQGMGVAAVVGIAGAGIAAWTALAGPHHISGPAQTRVALAGLSADPLGWVVPTLNEHYTFGLASVGDPLVAQRSASWKIVIDNLSENGTYIGLPLILLLGAGTVWLRRRPVIRFSAAMAAVALVLTLGSRLHVDGRLTPIPMPFDVLSQLPLLDSSVAARYVLYFWLFAAVMLAVFLYEIRSTIRSRCPAAARFWAGAGAALVAVVALVPLVPDWPLPVRQWTAPAWFASGSGTIPAGSAALVYPEPSPGDAEPMAWQAVARFRFSMPGGYLVLRSPSGPGTFQLPGSTVLDAMQSCAILGRSAVSARAVLARLHQQGIRYVIVPLSARHAGCVAALLTPVAGPPTVEQGVEIWTLTNANASG